MAQCNLVTTLKDSDVRFLWRLFASWGLFIAFWITIIISSTTIVIGVCMFVGHHFNGLTGFADEPRFNEFHNNFQTHGPSLMALDTLVGVLLIVTAGLLFGVLFFMGYNVKHHHYDPWYRSELKFLEEDKIKQVEREEALLTEFSELDNYNSGQSREFWHTIPEYLKFKYYFDKFCPRGSLRRYICRSAFYTTGDLIIILLICVVLRHLGWMIKPEKFPVDKKTGQEITGITLIFIEWAFGFILVSVIGLICMVIWNTVISSCIKEWNLHQEKKKVAMTKLD